MLNPKTRRVYLRSGGPGGGGGGLTGLQEDGLGFGVGSVRAEPGILVYNLVTTGQRHHKGQRIARLCEQENTDDVRATFKIVAAM